MRLNLLACKLRRVDELRSLISDPADESAYFRRDFDERLRESPARRRVWRARERELQRLDDDAWAFLKNEAHPYLNRKDNSGRGWQQLFTILNMASAYNFLCEQLRCVNVQFVPRDSRAERPDLEGELDGRVVLCEVKTISASDDEIRHRRDGTVRSSGPDLGHGFFEKLSSDLEKARRQADAYKADSAARKIAYIVIDFDDSLGEYKDAHYSQIDEFLAERDFGTEIVFFNRVTPFHPEITMRNAVLINETIALRSCNALQRFVTFCRNQVLSG
jgi:hypothetical protein